MREDHNRKILETEADYRQKSYAGSSGTVKNKNQKERIGYKRLFIGLVLSLSLLLSLILFLSWGIPYIGLSNIHHSVPYITGSIFVIIVMVIFWTSAGLILQVLSGKELWGSKKIRGLTIKLFLPVMEAFGRVFRIPPAAVRYSFIQVNNDIIVNKNKRYPAAKILILLPHCLQWSECTIHINYKLEHCKRCGNCDIAGLLDLTEKYGVAMAIATGGTIARRIVVEKNPEFILAVACERDLSSGIQDTYPLPVYGVLNQRPQGPCRDTKVNLSDLEEALNRFILKKTNI